ncbi:ATP-dependent DNA/RNA helicase DHX36-like isoform X2 [Bacillus rossius redtenbacheri]
MTNFFLDEKCFDTAALANLPALKLDSADKENIKRVLQDIKPSLAKLKLSNSAFDGSVKPNASTLYDCAGDSDFKNQFLQSITGSIDSRLASSLSTLSILERDRTLDAVLKNELLDKQESPSYAKMLEFRKQLPAFQKRAEILSMISSHQVVLISGETGCGKTTQVAQFILDDFISRGDGSKCHIVCTQPRRISAVSVAERVAQERDDSCGGASVGYHIRLEGKLPRPNGSILFCTTGMLLQYMRSDPGLSSMSHLILDEIHERDVFCDFVLAILKDIIRQRKDLKIILMSATLNAENFSRYFHNCPMMEIPGFTYPVEEFYLEDVLQLTAFTRFTGPPIQVQRTAHAQMAFIKQRKQFEDHIVPYARGLKSQMKYSDHVIESLAKSASEELNVELIEALISYICRSKGEGAILVFLPGWNEISSLESLLTEAKGYPADHYLIIPLHSQLPTVTQKSVFDQPPPGVRKIVLATNIAETSITINDVVYVIDSGKMKMKNFDSENNVATLQAEWVSRSNSRQRKGRAGRVQPGICYHLYSKGRENLLAEYPIPEMLRTRLEEVILQMKILQLGQAHSFLTKVMNSPEQKVIALSVKLLRDLKALDEHENLTPLGYHLANLPLDPHIGKMILMAAIFSCIDPIFTVAASLSFKDPFIGSMYAAKKVSEAKQKLLKGHVSDHLAVAEAMRQWEQAKTHEDKKKFCQEHFVSGHTLYMLRDMKGQFAQYLYEMNFLESKDFKFEGANVNSDNVALVNAIICAGLYPNIAIFKTVEHNRRSGRRYVKFSTREDGLIGVHPKSYAESLNSFASPIVVYHLKLKSSFILLHDVSMVYPMSLVFFGEKVTCDNNALKVTDQIKFSCVASHAALIKELRDQLDILLKYKITHPGSTDWSESNFEAKLLRTVISLIESEDKRMTVVS